MDPANDQQPLRPPECPGGDGVADPTGKRPTLMHAGQRWHLDCLPARIRHGLDHPLPPHARPAKPPPAKPVSMDPDAMRRLRRR